MALERPLSDAKRPIPASYPPDPLPPLLKGGTLNVLGGSPLTGKTPLIAWLIRQFLEGQVLGYPVPANAVSEHCFLSMDRSFAQTAAQWFTDLPVKVYAPHDDLAYDTDQVERKSHLVEIFEDCLDRLNPAPNAVVWVDPLTVFLGGSLLDVHSCFTACTKIRRRIQRRRITVIGTAHSSKQKANPQERYVNLIDRVAASAQLFAFLDTCFYLASPRELERNVYTLVTYPRTAASEQFDFVRAPKTGEFVLAPPDVEYGAVLALVPEPPDLVATGELQRHLCVPGGMSRATLFRQLRELIGQGQILQVRQGRYQRRRLA